MYNVALKAIEESEGKSTYTIEEMCEKYGIDYNEL